VANFLVWVVWLGAAFGCLASALAVVTFRNPFYSALSLIGNLASLAVLFLLPPASSSRPARCSSTAAPVMVIFLFVIALPRGQERGLAGVGGTVVAGCRRRARGRRDPRRGDRRRLA